MLVRGNDRGSTPMATSPETKASSSLTTDLLPVLRRSGILFRSQYDEIVTKTRDGRYPTDPVALAKRLVKERVLTEFQARCVLHDRAMGLRVGRYVILDRIGKGAMG